MPTGKMIFNDQLLLNEKPTDSNKSTHESIKKLKYLKKARIPRLKKQLE
tara:strand:+ start:56 stop:202 length:147 start_codon:yes stop_codon:yes gene_type:complete